MYLIAKNKQQKTIDNKRPLPDNEMTKTLKQADILLFRWRGKKDFLGGSIGYFTNSPYSHAEIYLFNGFGLSATASGVIYDDLFDPKREEQDVDIFRHLSLTREQRLIILAKAQQSLLKPYDYMDLLFFPFANKRQIAKWSKNNAYICSEVTSWAYKEAGIDLVPKKLEAIEAPADIAHSKLLIYIGTYHIPSGKSISSDLRNKFLPYQQYSNAVKSIGDIIKSMSKRDEEYK